MPLYRSAPSARLMVETLVVRDCRHAQIRIMYGDLTGVKADVMVTGAGNRLAGREGVDSKMHDAAGPEMRADLVKFAKIKRKTNEQPCPVGENVMTKPYNLPAKIVIHAVGPDCRRPNQDLQRRELLQTVYDNLFETIAGLDDCETVVMPPLSMDIFSYPHREGARLTMGIVLPWLDGERDIGIRKLLMITDQPNFINNMKTVYRESEDQFLGVDRTRDFRRGLLDD